MNKHTPLVRYPLYTLADLSSGIYSVVPGILLMFYMTNILAIPVGMASVAVFLPKIADILANPLIGRYSDRASTRLGRRRPFILFSALTLLPAFALIWVVPFSSPSMAAAFVAVASCLCALCVAIFYVPYCTLSSELPGSYADSMTLTSYRVFYAMLGGLVAGAVAPLIVEKFGGGKAGYLAMGGIMGAVMALGVLVTFLSAREPARPQAPQNLHAAHKDGAWKLIANNRPFALLTGAYFSHILGGSATGTVLAYFVMYVLRKEGDFLSLAFLCIFASAMLAMPVLLRIGKRFGKFFGIMLCLLLIAAANLCYIGFGKDTPSALILAVFVMQGAGTGGVQLFVFSMLADCIRHGDSRSEAEPQEALLTGMFVTGERVGLAAGALVAGAILGWAGLVETSEGFAEQTASAITGIRMVAAMVPLILNACAILLLWNYRSFDRSLSKKPPEKLV